MVVESAGASGIDRAQGKPKSYEAVFTDNKDNTTLKASDFLKLMIVQMRNQDFLNPMDDNQFMTQMAQFTTMQQMTELAEWSKSNYAMSLVGKTVTATRYNVSGNLDTVTGVVDKISFVNNEYVLYIGDKTYTLAQVMEVHTGAAGAGKAVTDGEDKKETPALDASGLKISAGTPTDNAAVVYWEAPTKDAGAASQLRYTVYYSTDGPFDTVDAVKTGMISGQANRADLKVDTIVGLEPGASYYVNVLVKDAKGNESVYQPVRIVMKDVKSVIEKPPVDIPPVDIPEVPLEDEPIEEIPVEDVPVEEVPDEDTPARETEPAGDTQTDLPVWDAAAPGNESER